MNNMLLTIAAFVSAVLFPWPLTALLSVGAAYFEPLVPLAVGIFADTLYYAPQASRFPWLQAGSLGLRCSVLP
jgi:hypothetical protein